jgi:hypothetical protein
VVVVAVVDDEQELRGGRGWSASTMPSSRAASPSWRRAGLTCAHVREARLLGFTRSTCVGGSELGLVLVRSIWRAEVDLLPWDPRFEIPWRRVVPIADLADHLWMESGNEPIFRRAAVEAGLA